MDFSSAHFAKSNVSMGSNNEEIGLLLKSNESEHINIINSRKKGGEVFNSISIPNKNEMRISMEYNTT